MSKVKAGLFKPPKHKWIAKIVSFKSPRAAARAAKRLLKALARGRTPGGAPIGQKRALTIYRALVYAANRAEAAAKRRELSAKEREELLQIYKIYRKAADIARKLYHRKYAAS